MKRTIVVAWLFLAVRAFAWYVMVGEHEMVYPKNGGYWQLPSNAVYVKLIGETLPFKITVDVWDAANNTKVASSSIEPEEGFDWECVKIQFPQLVTQTMLAKTECVLKVDVDYLIGEPKVFTHNAFYAIPVNRMQRIAGGKGLSDPRQVSGIETLALAHFDVPRINVDATKRHTVDPKGHVPEIPDVFMKFLSGLDVSKSLAYAGVDATVAGSTGDFDIGTSDFTIDFWFWYWLYTVGTNNWVAISQGTSVPFSTWAIHLTDSKFTFSTDGNDSYAWSLPDMDEWHHYALVRTGSTLTLYIDGVSQGSKNIGTTPLVANGESLAVSSCIGHLDAEGQYRLDELRITRNALWTENFTVPTKPWVFYPR